MTDHAETLEGIADRSYMTALEKAACRAGAEALRECARLRARVEELKRQLRLSKAETKRLKNADRQTIRHA
jgi:hypothetical protein